MAHLKTGSLRDVAGVAGYIALCAVLHRPLRILGHTIKLPSVRMALAQLAIGTLDNAVAAAILWVLLPAGAQAQFMFTTNNGGPGGTDKGWRWYLDGKREKKTNTFDDFAAAGRALSSPSPRAFGHRCGRCCVPTPGHAK